MAQYWNGCWVLIPLFRSFIFTKNHWTRYWDIEGFNPFIQVFYFYLKIKEAIEEYDTSFNPFIQVFYFYLRTASTVADIKGLPSFNPFIQVFYFYKAGNIKNILEDIKVLIPLFRSFIFTKDFYPETQEGFDRVLIPLFRSFIFTNYNGNVEFFSSFALF